MSRFALLLLLASLAFAGCGYHVVGRGTPFPGEVETVYIEMFANRTTEPFLEDILTNDIVEQFARRRGLRVVEQAERADALLQGSVIHFSSRPVGFDSEDRINEFSARIGVRAQLQKRESGRVLWQSELTWAEEFAASIDDITEQEKREQVAIRSASRRLAENLYFSLLENF